MKKKLALLFGYLFIGIGLITAQTQKVTGTVISDDDKQPVVGASIVVKGTNLGTITDIDGHFTLLNVPNSAKILQISYIGMKTESVPVQPTVRVILKSDTQLMDEVVVVGYGSAKKLGSVVGSVTTVNNSKIANRPVANAGDALQGQVAGLQVFTPSGEPSGSCNAIAWSQFDQFKYRTSLYSRRFTYIIRSIYSIKSERHRKHDRIERCFLNSYIWLPCC